MSRSRQPTFDALEARDTPSASASNVLAAAAGNVPTPGAIARVPLAIEARNLANLRRSTVLGFDARPAAGAPVVPQPIGAVGPNGRALAFRFGAPYVARFHPRAIAYAKATQPGTLGLDVTGRGGTTGSFDAAAYLPGDVNGDGTVDLNDLDAFAAHYGARVGDPNYLLSADGDRNGQIGQGDARFILRNLTPLTPKVPLRVSVSLAPRDLIRFPTVTNDPDAITRHRDVTIVGHTTPGSIVFFDGPVNADYKFEEAAIPTDANGFFSYRLHLDSALTNTEYLVVDPYGQQTTRAMPIRLLM